MSPRFAHITGWGMAVPERILTNADLEKMVDTEEEWIVSRTGIRQRHSATDGQTTATLAADAALRALEVSVSMAAAAVRMAERIFPSLSEQNVLFIGAGEMIELCMTHFAAQSETCFGSQPHRRARAPAG